MKILIIGGSKFIGKAVAAHAAQSGHEVTLFNRGLQDPTSPHTTIRGDVERLSEFKSTLRALRPDAIIHCIAFNERHAADLIDVFSDIARLVVLGSQDCYEAFYQLNRGRDVAEVPIAEDGLTCPVRHYWKDLPGIKTHDDYDKNLLTTALLGAHAQGQVRASVLRLPMVFGPGDFQFRHRHGKFIRRIYDKQPTLVLGAVEQTSLYTFGYIDNVAAAIVHAAETPAVDGKIYNIGESKSRSLRRWAELYGEAAGGAYQIAILPDTLTELDRDSVNRPPRLILFDSRAFSSETGFTEPVSLPDQVMRTLAWGLKHPEALGPLPDYPTERRLIEVYGEFVKTHCSSETRVN